MQTQSILYWTMVMKTLRAAVDVFRETGLYNAVYRRFHLEDCWFIVERKSNGFIELDLMLFRNGIKLTMDCAHSRGLTFGIYTSGGKVTEEWLFQKLA